MSEVATTVRYREVPAEEGRECAVHARAPAIVAVAINSMRHGFGLCARCWEEAKA